MFLLAESHRIQLCSALAFAMLLPFSQAHAKCSESEIRQLSEDGETVADIADECEISKAEVRKIIKRVDGPPGGGNGLPSGTALAPCGCYGPVDPRVRQPAQQCASGYAQPQMCNAMCQLGGFMWQGVCL